MAENNTKQERSSLNGEVNHGPTTDEAIRRDLDRLTQEVRGFPIPEVVIDGEPYAPKPMVPSAVVESVEVESARDLVDTNVKLGSFDSALGHFITQDRIKKLKKAA